MRRPGAILLVSTYELGHPPHALAMMAGYLERAGFAPRSVDLAVDELTAAAVADAELVVFSTPMHTALRLALSALQEVMQRSPAPSIAFVGHYAQLHRQLLERSGVDWVLAGEFEEQLVELVRALEEKATVRAPVVSLKRQGPVAPQRRGIDELAKYARYIDANGGKHLCGYSETTRGCLESCRHCPIPAVYNGRFVAIDSAIVLQDIAAQVDAGAGHITFGDPDFLNGPTHALRVCRELNRRWPSLTFDFTAQVANLLEHDATTAELCDLGCSFVVTAIESLSDRVLEQLGKRHRRADIDALLARASSLGLTLRPTLVPFTPWTEIDDIASIADWIANNQLERHVAPVQMSVRLLVPPGSLLLASHGSTFQSRDDSALSFTWDHTDPRVDRLAATLANEIAEASDAGTDDVVCHEKIRALARREAGMPTTAASPRPRARVPRVSEPWFC